MQDLTLMFFNARPDPYVPYIPRLHVALLLYPVAYLVHLLPEEDHIETEDLAKTVPPSQNSAPAAKQYQQ